MINLNQQGGYGGTTSVYLQSEEAALPDITPPWRTGYTFGGYFSQPSGSGTRYYNDDGSGVLTLNVSESITFYAKWIVCSYDINYENMEGASSTEPLPQVHTYGTRTTIPEPVREGYTFFGWRVNENTISQQGLTLGAYDFFNTVTLSAVWNKAALVSVVDNATQTVQMSSENLRRLFYRQVTDPKNGITAIDLDSEEVRLTMTASDANEQAEGAAEVIALAQGDVMRLYDFSVSKTVTAHDGKVTVMNLNELPATVQIDITLSDSLAGKSGYRVYRYHDKKAQAVEVGPIENAAEIDESFFVSADGKTLTIHTRRLSTYVIVANTKTVSQAGQPGMDVQAMVKSSGMRAVYRVDIQWGFMKFYYSVDALWDPEKHRYDEEQRFAWAENFSYENGNNQVTVYNHSNADILVSMFVTNQNLPGVDMQIFSQNTVAGTLAENLLVSRVPRELAAAPAVSGYLRLNGTPDNWQELVTNTDNNGFIKVANIAVTITELDSELTPPE